MQASFKVMVLLLAVAASGSLGSADDIKECEKSYDGLLARLEPSHLWACLTINATDFSYHAQENIRIEINDVPSKVEPANTILVNVPDKVSITKLKYYWQKYDKDDWLLKYREIAVSNVCRIRNQELLVIELAENLNSSSTGAVSFEFKSSIPMEKTVLMNKIGKKSAFVHPKIQTLIPIFNDEKFSTIFNLEFAHNSHVEVTSTTCKVTERHYWDDLTISVIFPQQPIHLSEVDVGLRRV